MFITAYKGLVGYNPNEFVANPFDALSKCGSFGMGLYFGDYNCAVSYAESDAGVLFEAQIATDKLLVVHSFDDLIDKYDIDTYAIPLISKLLDLSEEGAAAYFAEHSVEDFYLGEDMLVAARAKGYDAIQVLYNGRPDVFEIIALVPESVLKVRLIAQGCTAIAQRLSH